MILPARLTLAATAAALLAGCAAQGPFPSLAPRAVEREFADGSQPAPPCLPGESPVPAPAVPIAETPRDTALAGRLSALRAQAAEGDRAFETAIAAAAAAVAKAGAAGSESWIEAQQAVSRAESARTPTVDALSDLTALAVAEAERRAHPADQQAIQAAIAELQALTDRQTARISDLQAPLSAL